MLAVAIHSHPISISYFIPHFPFQLLFFFGRVVLFSPLGLCLIVRLLLVLYNREWKVKSGHNDDVEMTMTTITLLGHGITFAFPFRLHAIDTTGTTEQIPSQCVVAISRQSVCSDMNMFGCCWHVLFFITNHTISVLSNVHFFVVQFSLCFPCASAFLFSMIHLILYAFVSTKCIIQT